MGAWVERWTQGLSDVEAAAVALVARVAPWLPPLPTAWLVYDRTTRHLGWPAWTGVAAGAAVECLGMLSTFAAVQLYSYNRAKLRSEPAAPTWLPVALAGFYVAVAEALTVGLELLAPAGGLWAWRAVVPGAFPLLSVVGMVLLALRADHRARVSGNAAAAERRRRGRRRHATGATADAAAVGQKQAPQAQNRPHSRHQNESAGSAAPGADTSPTGALVATHGLRAADRARLDRLRAVFAPGATFTRAEAETALGLKSTAAGALLAKLVSRQLAAAGGSGRSRHYWLT